MKCGLASVPLRELVGEIQRRSKCSMVVVQLKESQAQADVRHFLQCEAGEDISFVGLVQIAAFDVTRTVHNSKGLESHDDVL